MRISNFGLRIAISRVSLISILTKIRSWRRNDTPGRKLIVPLKSAFRNLQSAIVFYSPAFFEPLREEKREMVSADFSLRYGEIVVHANEGYGLRVGIIDRVAGTRIEIPRLADAPHVDQIIMRAVELYRVVGMEDDPIF